MKLASLNNKSIRTLLFIWAAWVVIIIGFQTLADARLIDVKRPDNAREWTPEETGKNSVKDRIYLNEPFMNRQVSFDSEYYLSIAINGYDDTAVTQMQTRGGTKISLNHAFFPFYPALMSLMDAPLGILGMNPIATATLAGVIVSILGTLLAMFSLYILTRDELEESGGIRTAFYLLIFPSGLFLAQVFTEGLFVGLAFGCLALLRYKKIFWAGVLAALATWTRAIGLALMIPLALTWLSTLDWRSIREKRLDILRPYVPHVLGLVAIFLPVVAYLIWNHFLGKPFNTVEEQYFGHKLFDLKNSFEGWKKLFEGISGGNLQERVYNLLEVSSVIIAVLACLLTLRRYPGIALFGLLAVAVSALSGDPQSMIRYVLAVPSIYILLSRWGRSQAFDRAWTLASVLVMGLLTILYTFNMWVA
ncbi:MAG: hypothetical protein ABI690_29295 [Chloroflexota bacterium]